MRKDSEERLRVSGQANSVSDNIQHVGDYFQTSLYNICLRFQDNQ